MSQRLPRIARGSALAAVVAAIAVHRGSLSPSGGIAATAIGALAFANGTRATTTLLTFFTSATALSHIPHEGRRQRPQRTASQVFANGGLAGLAWALSLLSDSQRGHSWATGALAAAAADTWATEIGQRWGGTPRLITTGRRVKPGESGGITLLGTLGAIAGAAAVSLIAAAPRAFLRRCVGITLAGVAGALADSLLGALAQARYQCPACGHRGESAWHCGTRGILRHGWSWIDNDTVNRLATLVGAAVGAYAGRGWTSPHEQENRP